MKVGKFQVSAVIVALGSVMLYASVSAADWRSFKGEYSIAGEPLSDPVPGSGEYIYMTISGGAAKSIFDRMKSSRIEKDACGDVGMVMKISGNLVCTRKGGDYRCNFGVDPMGGDMKSGYTC